VCEQLAQGCYPKAQGRESNPRPTVSQVQRPNHYTNKPHIKASPGTTNSPPPKFGPVVWMVKHVYLNSQILYCRLIVYTVHTRNCPMRRTRGTRPLQLWRLRGPSVFGLLQLLQLFLLLFARHHGKLYLRARRKEK